jgi:hypothetical protein
MRDLQERRLLKVGKLFCWTELRENTRRVRTERGAGEAATKKIEDLRRNLFGVLLVRQTRKKAGTPTSLQSALPALMHSRLTFTTRILSLSLLSFPSSSISSPVPQSLNSCYTSSFQSTKNISFVAFVRIAIF